MIANHFALAISSLAVNAHWEQLNIGWISDPHCSWRQIVELGNCSQHIWFLIAMHVHCCKFAISVCVVWWVCGYVGNLGHWSAILH